MKPSNRIIKTAGLAALGLTALVLVALSFLFSPATPAYASDPTPTVKPAKPDDAAAKARLAKAYEYQQMRLRMETDHLTLANDAAGRTQTMIDNQKAQGKDTTALETALSTFKTQVAAAQAAHDTAAGILDKHLGFDDRGQVTDLAQARQTVKEANRYMQDTRLTLRQAELTLRIAIRAWRQANAPHPASPAP
jgi:hypothetical protein